VVGCGFESTRVVLLVKKIGGRGGGRNCGEIDALKSSISMRGRDMMSDIEPKRDREK